MNRQEIKLVDVNLATSVRFCDAVLCAVMVSSFPAGISEVC